MVRVSLNDIAKKFPDGTRVGPVDLEINDGELLTILGPSGSGKTTTLRIIAGFIHPDTGSLLFDDKDVSEIHPRDRGIGMVFQSIALFPHMSVFQNIAFGLELAGWKQREIVNRVELLAELLGIRGLLNRRSREISGGEAQRVALARALANKPSLLLLDEPLSSLDPQLRERLQTEIRSIQNELKITTIYVTHSQPEAFAISDRVAVLDNGVISQVGTPEELYDNPENEFVARFVGSGNVFKGLVKSVSSPLASVGVNDETFQVCCNAEVGDEIVFTVKPEDIVLVSEESENVATGQLVSISPQIGLHKVVLSFGSQVIVASAHDDALLDKLRETPDSLVLFSFKPQDAVVLRRNSQPA
ncbi:MAG: ABC transporter ATP-binding protein [Candidatus Thorarchaeota archaeon]|jgi:ABC-type Fe3+/spermidine/putrescine transport system ATPase subunit